MSVSVGWRPSKHQTPKVRVSVPPSWLRESSEDGTPRGLPKDTGARWAHVAWCYRRLDSCWIVEPGPILLPQLAGAHDDHHGYGRPRVADTDPARLAFAARAHDLLGLTHAEVADRLRGDADIKAARRDRDAGRKHLAALGVIPWRVWPNGKLPAAWWTDEAFVAAIDCWRRQAVSQPALAPRSAVEEAARALSPRREQVFAALLVPPPRLIRGQLLTELEVSPWRPLAGD